MGELSDLGALVKKGVIKLQGITDKHKQIMKAEDIHNLAKEMSNEMISQFNQFSQERVQYVEGKVEKGITLIKNHAEEAKKASEQISGQAKQLDQLIKKYKNEIDIFYHAEKERLYTELQTTLEAISSKATLISNSIEGKVKQVQGIVESVDKRADELATRMYDYTQEMGCMVEKHRDYIVREAQEFKQSLSTDIDKFKDQLFEQLLSYLVENFWKVLKKAIKRIFKR